jgi:hypothetical protein
MSILGEGVEGLSEGDLVSGVLEEVGRREVNCLGVEDLLNLPRRGGRSGVIRVLGKGNKMLDKNRQ